RLGANPTISNCLFQGNEGFNGGAIHNFQSSPTIINSSFQGNKSENGGALYNTSSSNPALSNCIIWLNRKFFSNTDPSASVFNNASTPTYHHCLVENWDLTGTGSGNFDGTNPANDPLFTTSVNPASSPQTGGDLHLLPASPAIGQGLNSANTTPTDLDGNARIIGAKIDLGPYETAVTFADLFPSGDPTLDSDENGFSDYYDYAAGGDLATTPALSQASGNTLFKATRRTESGDVYGQYEKSSNLIDWFPMIENVDYLIESSTSLDTGIEEITLRLLLIPDSTTNRVYFFRQSFSTSPPSP
ncbi:MAG: choice-of-anchor Q domain-containing protein, partial [Verrucomicrobiota bacterium]